MGANALLDHDRRMGGRVHRRGRRSGRAETKAATERLAPMSASEAQTVMTGRPGPVRERLRMLLTALVLNLGHVQISPGLWPRQHNGRRALQVQRSG